MRIVIEVVEMDILEDLSGVKVSLALEVPEGLSNSNLRTILNFVLEDLDEEEAELPEQNTLFS